MTNNSGSDRKCVKAAIFSQRIPEGGNSQNFLGKLVRFFVTLGLRILRLFRLKELFEANITKG